MVEGGREVGIGSREYNNGKCGKCLLVEGAFKATFESSF